MFQIKTGQKPIQIHNSDSRSLWEIACPRHISSTKTQEENKDFLLKSLQKLRFTLENSSCVFQLTQNSFELDFNKSNHDFLCMSSVVRVYQRREKMLFYLGCFTILFDPFNTEISFENQFVCFLENITYLDTSDSSFLPAE